MQVVALRWGVARPQILLTRIETMNLCLSAVQDNALQAPPLVTLTSLALLAVPILVVYPRHKGGWLGVTPRVRAVIVSNPGAAFFSQLLPDVVAAIGWAELSFTWLWQHWAQEPQKLYRPRRPGCTGPKLNAIGREGRQVDADGALNTVSHHVSCHQRPFRPRTRPQPESICRRCYKE
jgi:hypothetical protein